MEDRFFTIRVRVRAETRVRGSRFIGTAIPVGSREEAEAVVAEIRKEHHSATHNCFAYRLGVGGEISRFNDDGEPSGSAGRPILGALERADLTDIVVVVTRYFGGTKLGVGGLARAYGDATTQALERAARETRYLTGTILLSIPHAYVGEVMRAVSRFGARIGDSTYDEEVHLRLEIRRSRLDEVKAGLVECTAGNIRFAQDPGDKGQV
jgi:uncharacterized YigZ family protein